MDLYVDKKLKVSKTWFKVLFIDSSISFSSLFIFPYMPCYVYNKAYKEK